jgi:NAD(P)H-hydrate epimerase
VTVALPRGLNLALEAKLDEVMTLPCPETPGGGLAPEAEATIGERLARTDVLAIGPGLGADPGSLHLARRLTGAFPGPVVIDADAIGALAEQRWTRPEGAPPAVLTPHPGEMARLAGLGLGDLLERRVEVAESYARRHRCTLVLKGAPTMTAAPDGAVWVNPTGNAGLATGGSGDVLTGVIAGLLGQGLRPTDAARLGAFLHGYAADRARRGTGIAGLLPTDVIEALPAALLALEGGGERDDDPWISASALRVP